MSNPDCVFCRIALGKERASYVWDDPHVFGMMSLEQPTPYKVLIIPKKHVETIFDLDDELAGAIFRATVKVARALRAASGCAGMNIVQSNGKLGQQDVFHFHLHLVPRFPDDDIQLGWDNTPEDRSRLDSLAEEIRSKTVVG
jgi:histidine triad (HIT) family protein